jgi:hypothetical protein
MMALCSSAADAALEIKVGDIQQDGSGYFYEYELDFSDLQTGNSKFENDVYKTQEIGVHKTPFVPLPDHPAPRWVYPNPGAFFARFDYRFDFSGIQIEEDGVDYYLSIDSVHLRDKVGLANNTAMNEKTSVDTSWSVDWVNYKSFTDASTPHSVLFQTTTGNSLIGQPGYIQTFRYRVTFTNHSTDGFDADINRWNNLTWSDKDHFSVIFRLSLIQAPPGTYAGGDGSESAPFEISTSDQLESLSLYPGDWDRHYVLVNDITMKGYGPYTQALVAPNPVLGSPDTWFTGSFDGNGKKIGNLIFDTDLVEKGFLGLFGGIGAEGEVFDLSLEDCVIRGLTSCSGLLVGYNSGTISGCQTSGAVLGIVSVADASSFLGGLVGQNEGIISNCDSTATVTGSAIVGGLVGYQIGSSGQIYQCRVHGSVQGQAYVGGLCGYVEGGSITESFSETEVFGSDIMGAGMIQYVGGLVGEAEVATLTDCYAHSRVHAQVSGAAVGGLVGALEEGSVENSYFAGRILVDADADYCGALVGVVHVVSFTACCYDSNTSGIAYGVDRPNPDPTGVTGYETSLMQEQTTFSGAGWDFTDTWEIRNGDSYPHLQCENACYAASPADVDGNCRVEFADFAVFAQYWLDCYALNPANCP